MFLVGLTGGIASGKSTVAQLWETLGATVDADDLAREVVSPGSLGLTRVVSEFGSDLLLDDGSLDRKALATKVFSDPERRKKLESILHPLIRELSTRRISEATTPIVVYVIPLLVETNSKLPFDFIVTVEAPKEKQIERLVNFRKMSAMEAKNRVELQASSVERANAADRILNSNQEIGLLLSDARRLFHEIEALSTAKGSET